MTTEEMLADLDTDTVEVGLQKIERLSRELADAAGGLQPEDVRYLVSAYYSVQQERIRAASQFRHVVENEEPQPIQDLLKYFFDGFHVYEENARRALQGFAQASEVGRWSMEQKGIGPVLAAGLLAHIDIEKAPHAGHIYSFAGLNPQRKWHGFEGMGELIRAAREAEDGDWAAFLWLCSAVNMKPAHVLTQTDLIKMPVSPEAAFEVVTEPVERSILSSDNILREGMKAEDLPSAYELLYPDIEFDWPRIRKSLARRPWNADLKVLCWKAGESFVKVSGYDDAYYGRVYAERKLLEIERNEEGVNAETAARTLTEKNFRSETVARAAYEAGRLPDAQVHARARRYAVKLFLSHWHYVAYESHHGEPPARPWIIEFGGHTDFQPPPGWPLAA